MAGAERRPGEFELIARYFRPLAVDPGALDLRDDAALVATSPGEELVVTVDALAEGVHFFADDPPASIARKALRVNLSDLAAKGAEPVGYLLAVALRTDWTEDWIAGFTEGLRGDQAAYGIALLGGDTTAASGGTTIAITAFGRVPKSGRGTGGMVTRGGARPGDRIFVSGTVGDAALGLRLRLGTLPSPNVRGGEAHLLDRYLHPRPRVALAPVLRRFASAAMDVSDGLVGDLGHICDVSGAGARIDAESVPLSPAAAAAVAADPSALATVLTGGDDYEILATVPEARAGDFAGEAASAGVEVTEIGRMNAEAGGPVVVGRQGKPIPLPHPGHVHF